MPVGDPAAPGAPDPLIGRVISERYRVLRKVGQGGMGVVYLAEHALIEKKIALKVLFPELTRRSDLVARFLQEAKSASRIGHENVIDIFDFGQLDDGVVYLAMEYLDGVDLGHILRTQGPMPWERARPILMQIAKGLRAAHERGIIHRDMKPENVFVTQREGRPDFVKVLDFGIAKVTEVNGEGPRLTQAGAIFGTPEYMSPEQAQGQPPDHRVDIYAVGCIMYQVLTGVVPFPGDSFMGILAKHMLEPVIPLRQRRPELDIPEEVEAIAMRAIEKDRDNRWPDMNALYRALGAAGRSHEDDGFELSEPHPPRASLKFPELAQPSAQARASHTAVLDPAAPRGSVSESLVPARAVSRKVIVGAGAALLAIAIAVGVLAMRGSAPAPSPTATAAANVPSTAAATATPTPTPTAGEAAGAAAGNGAPATPPGAEAAPKAAGPEEPKVVAAPARRPPRPGRTHGSETGERSAPGPRPMPDSPSTPPELKNPFNSP